jgi:ketosteroid isomerase-like protein
MSRHGRRSRYSGNASSGEEIVLQRSLVLMVFAASWGGFGASPAAMAADTPESVAQTKAEILKVNAELDRAVEMNDAEALGAVLSDRLQYTNQLGEIVNKAGWQDHVRSNQLKMLTIRHTVDGMEVFGNTVVLRGTSMSTVLFHGKKSEGPRKFTRVFLKQDGKWLLIAQHVSLVEKR